MKTPNTEKMESTDFAVALPDTRGRHCYLTKRGRAILPDFEDEQPGSLIAERLSASDCSRRPMKTIYLNDMPPVMRRGHVLVLGVRSGCSEAGVKRMLKAGRVPSFVLPGETYRRFSRGRVVAFFEGWGNGNREMDGTTNNLRL